MALYYELPVYKNTYQLILKIFECTRDFSRQYKYTLGQESITYNAKIFFQHRTIFKKVLLSIIILNFPFVTITFQTIPLRDIRHNKILLTGSIKCQSGSHLRESLL